jgi:hypothetical protein
MFGSFGIPHRYRVEMCGREGCLMLDEWAPQRGFDTYEDALEFVFDELARQRPHAIRIVGPEGWLVVARQRPTTHFTEFAAWQEDDA